MHYRIMPPADSSAASLLAAVRAYLANEPRMQMDRSRLTRLCCAPSVSAALKRAPKPASLVHAEVVEG
jgi:hypothetical protein